MLCACPGKACPRLAPRTPTHLHSHANGGPVRGRDYLGDMGSVVSKVTNQTFWYQIPYVSSHLPPTLHPILPLSAWCAGWARTRNPPPGVPPSLSVRPCPVKRVETVPRGTEKPGAPKGKYPTLGNISLSPPSWTFLSQLQANSGV